MTLCRAPELQALGKGCAESPQWAVGQKKVAVNGEVKLTVFEILCADGLTVGSSAKGVYIFLENSVPSAPGTGRRQRVFFSFKKNCADSPGQLKTFFVERHVQRSAKLGTPELRKFFPELPSVVAKTLGKGAFADDPSRQRGHILFNFFLSTLTNTHTHRYIYIYIWQRYSTS
jgi:hypothetical protein